MGKTILVNAKAALIIYDFADVSQERPQGMWFLFLPYIYQYQLKIIQINVCPDFKTPANCRVEYNYAVRLGCIDCKPGITREELNKFLANKYI
jgi:hypothetical protein